jgi:hypothetical protein
MLVFQLQESKNFVLDMFAEGDMLSAGNVQLHSRTDRRWMVLCRVAVQDHCPLCSRQSRDAISGPDDAVVAESPSQGIYHTIPNVCYRR